MFGFSSPFRAAQSAPRRPRNPRFAPELLESRLAPSGLVEILAAEPAEFGEGYEFVEFGEAQEVAPMGEFEEFGDPEEVPTPDPTYLPPPAPEDGIPPIYIIPTPNDPVMPA